MTIPTATAITDITDTQILAQSKNQYR